MEHRLDYMFPGDLDQRLADGKDTAVLPIGSVEQHGPHLLLGCDSFISQMLADFTAEISGGVLFPMVPYSWIGGLRVWPGTIDIRSKNMGNYLEEVCVGILNMGFKKLLIVNCHGGGREMVFSAATRVFKRTGIPVLPMYPSHVYGRYPELMKIWEKYGVADSEASSMMGGLKKYGKMEILKKVEGFVKEAVDEFGEVSAKWEPSHLKKAFELNEVGHDYLEEIQHVSPRKNVSADAGIEFSRAMAEKLAEAVENLDTYLKELGID